MKRNPPESIAVIIVSHHGIITQVQIARVTDQHEHLQSH